MATVERVIPPTIADDGSVHYSSVMSPSDDSIAVCHMVPDRVIPVIFVPGVMGTNLMDSNKKAVWLVDSTWSVLKDWGGRGADKWKQVLDPQKTDVYSGGTIPQGTGQTDDELRRRGWGEVGNMSYGTFLPWLENALNDSACAREGGRAGLMKNLVAQSHGVDLLSHDEVAMSYKYQFPVHAVGYNWLQSNAVSAKRLDSKIQEFMKHYRGKGFMCSYVIIVTHSMGGLVARYYSEVDNHRANVLGIVHGVMPATGSATAYKRVKAGTEMPAGLALGSDAAQMTAVFAQAPGPLQLLPSPEYGMNWLKIRDGQQLTSLPTTDPYSEIYVKRCMWWSLCDDKLINPLDQKKQTVEQDWAAYEELIKNEVLLFHKALAGPDRSGLCHGNTYAFYGDDPAHSTWGDVVWKRRIAPYYESRGGMPKMDNPLDGNVISGDGKGYVGLKSDSGGKPDLALFDLQLAGDNGDGTVPVRSGRAPGRRVKACVPFPGVDHEGAYKERAQQLFALWAVTRIAYTVRYTNMAYKT